MKAALTILPPPSPYQFHPWRLPVVDLWRDILQKAKASGNNAISIYVPWHMTWVQSLPTGGPTWAVQLTLSHVSTSHTKATQARAS